MTKTRARELSRLRYAKNDADFESEGTRCAGWLYTPEGVADPPVVMMAHGLGGERTFGLPKIAKEFVARGFAVFLFDYRNFGDSDGEPRNLVSASRHVEDWEAAIDHVRGLDAIDRRKIALWGTSYSGGHVIEAAADDHRIAAVIAQVPFVDGRTVARASGAKKVLKGTFAGVRDLVRKYTFRGPHTVPVAGYPDEFAVLNAPGAMEGMETIVPDPPVWENEVPARVFLEIPFYRPISVVEDVPCPLLLIGGRDDDIVPVSSIRSAAERADATYIELPIGHFDVYDDAFDAVVGYEAAFLDREVRE
ncbi:alpha/beta hydrolase fold protein [Haladaptatus paucihalophilus DX253]|uniref:Alpha/beta hydrolase fold protein n=1 Tax=Haladaptatus paucihalophilus DX253 TaxID=797209 RepID=E7QR02_HALPU|nr:alpha/beta fold hydrolase [Haladaptatus paucihalophilus]EFW93416.1 alpha/beta hydrolase fold protein [Haladaptatus paucihalophilus DX253]SHK54062.1 Serine aminopeptidase, S33 [Haladaptatus paucihalophilus DX253]